MSAGTSQATAAGRGCKAIVLSGGGADGAYSIGVLKALLSGRAQGGQREAPGFDIFAGTSIGSFNAAFMVSHWGRYGAATVGELERVWLDRLAEGRGCLNGAYRIKADPVTVLRPSCLLADPPGAVLRFVRDSTALGWEGMRRFAHFVSADERLLQRTAEIFNFASFVSREPWSRTIRETIDFQDIRASDLKLCIVATNWSTGELRTFTNADMGNELGPQAIEASSALPGFFPPAAVGSQIYVDGAVLQNTPLMPAIDAGASEIHIVYLDPDIQSIPLADEENTLETLYRMQQIAWAASVDADIHAARRINEVLAMLDLGDAAGRPGGPVVDRLVEHYARYRPITIHRYSPREDLGGALGLLNLERPRLEGLIEQGFEETVEHDCAGNGCILTHLDESIPGEENPAPGSRSSLSMEDPRRSSA